MPHTKALDLEVSDKNSFFYFVFLYVHAKHASPGRAYLWPKGHNLNSLGRDSLDAAAYQVSRL